MVAAGARLGHVNLEVSDLRRARRFYDEILPVLGFRRLSISDASWVGYRKGRMTLWLTVSRPRRARRGSPRVPTTGATDPISDHLGFRVQDSQTLISIERTLLEAGLKPIYRFDRVATVGRTWYVSDAWQDPDHNVIELYTTEKVQANRTRAGRPR